MKTRQFIIVVLSIVITGFVAAVWNVNRTIRVSNVQSDILIGEGELVRPHSPILGSDTAPVTIVEFFDPACETCRAFHPILKDILETYPDDVRVVIRYTPFHGRMSEFGVRILETARLQGIFEPVLESILRDQPEWASHTGMRLDSLINTAISAGLNSEDALKQIMSSEVTRVFNQDWNDVDALGVQKTPTFFVNGILVDPFGEDQLRQLVADEVEAIRE